MEVEWIIYFCTFVGFLNTLFCYSQVKLSEKATLLETAESEIAELTAKVNEQQKLIQKLEDDILKVCFNDLWKIPESRSFRFNDATDNSFARWIEIFK